LRIERKAHEAREREEREAQEARERAEREAQEAAEKAKPGRRLRNKQESENSRRFWKASC